MLLLMILTISGGVVGAAGGMFVGGGEGLILGGSAGICGGVMLWMVAGMIERINVERRLDRHFRSDALDQ
jgi:outer membrane lipoprotein SlyB